MSPSTSADAKGSILQDSVEERQHVFPFAPVICLGFIALATPATLCSLSDDHELIEQALNRTLAISGCI